MHDYLFLGSFIVVLSVTTVWFIRALETVAKSCYRAFLPSATGSPSERSSVMPRLSRTLQNLPMPWGWSPADRHTADPVRPDTAPVDVVIPWGWPGNPFQDHRRSLHKDAHGQGEDEKHAADVLQFPLPRDNEDLSGQKLRLEITGNQYGGFKFSSAGRAPRLDARRPWGW